MSNFKDMPLDTTLQKGDVVTITGPGEHDVLVREVRGFMGDGLVVGAGLNVSTTILIPRNGRTLTRVQRPVPALPTVEGDYIFTSSAGVRTAHALREDVWLNAWGDKDDACWLAAQLGKGATLTRVIPADEVKRPAVSVTKASAALVDAWGNSENTRLTDDFEAVLERVLKGEFDL